MKKKQGDLLSIGNYVFEYPPTHSKKKPLSKGVYEELFDTTLNIGQGKFTRKRWSRILKYVKCSQVSKIIANHSPNSNILISIQTITFPNLKQLDLRDCMILNVQSMLSGPYLQRVSLMNNYIRKITCFQKNQFCSLKQIFMNQNPLKDHNMSRFNMKLETFWLQRKFNSRVICQDIGLTGIFKLNSINLTNISIQGPSRIWQGSQIEKIKQKCQKVEQFFYADDEDNSELDFVFGFAQGSDNQDQEVQNAAQFNPPPLQDQGFSSEQWQQSDEKIKQNSTLKQLQKQEEKDEKQLKISKKFQFGFPIFRQSDSESDDEK